MIFSKPIEIVFSTFDWIKTALKKLQNRTIHVSIMYKEMKIFYTHSNR